MVKKVEKSDKKKIEKFKADYNAIKADVNLLKQKLCEIKKMVKPISKAAYRLYERGDKTMYNEEKGRFTTPKFETLSIIMGDLEAWMELDDNIQNAIDNTYSSN